MFDGLELVMEAEYFSEYEEGLPEGGEIDVDFVFFGEGAEGVELGEGGPYLLDLFVLHFLVEFELFVVEVDKVGGAGGD
jgi:hypothetical protein